MSDSNYIKKQLKKTNKEVGKIIESEIVKLGEQVRLALKKELKAKFYGREGFEQDQAGTEWYTRTWELLNSIVATPVKIDNGEYIVQVYYNTDTMHTAPAPPEGGWSTHESVTTGTDVRAMIPYWVEFGLHSPLYSWKAFNIVGDLTDRFSNDQVVLQWFKTALERQGIKCE